MKLVKFKRADYYRTECASPGDEGLCAEPGDAAWISPLQVEAVEAIVRAHDGKACSLVAMVSGQYVAVEGSPAETIERLSAAMVRGLS